MLVEKPLADSVSRGRTMVDLADAQGLVLMTDHTYCYTPAVQKMRELVGSGELGEVHFVDSVRINLGLVQPDIDVLWDLAPHDLVDPRLRAAGGLPTTGIGATGADPIGAGRACVGHLTLPLPDDGLAHVHVNWLSPTKIRQMVIGGSRRTLVWDDLNPQQRLSIYDRGVDLARTSVAGADRAASTVSYRLGDTWSPALPEREALGSMVGEFAAAIHEGRPALTDGRSGLRVLEVLEAASQRLAQRSEPSYDAALPVPAGPPPVPRQAGAARGTGRARDGGRPMTALAGATALVTGGAGTIGSTLVDQLFDAGAAQVRVLDNFVRGREANLGDALGRDGADLVLVRGDIRDRDLVHDLTSGCDVVFHQAAIRITQCAEEPRLALEVLVDGTFNVVEAAASTPGVDKLVAASSASVYGLAEEFPTPEHQHPYDNDTFYGAAKTFNEGMLRSFRAMHGLDYVALRYFNVYGPRMDVHGLYTEVLVRWMERIDDGLPPLIFGDGRQTMDFVFTTDIARANVLAASCRVVEGVYNVARGEETSLLGLAEALLRVMGSDLPVEHGPERGVNGVVRRLADTRAAERDLGFTADHRARGRPAPARGVVAPPARADRRGTLRGGVAMSSTTSPSSSSPAST